MEMSNDTDAQQRRKAVFVAVAQNIFCSRINKRGQELLKIAFAFGFWSLTVSVALVDGSIDLIWIG